MARGNDDERRPARLLSLLASAPTRLVVALLVAGCLTLWLGQRLAVETIAVPTPVAIGGDAPIDASGHRLMVVLVTDQLTPEYISAIERITDLSGRLTGVERVRSVTNTLVLAKAEPYRPIATPAFGTASKLPLSMSLPERAQLAAASRLGSSDLISSDGKTMTVIAELHEDVGEDTAQQSAQSFRDLVDHEVDAAGLPATVYLAGDTYTIAAARDGMRVDLYLLVGLALIVPAVVGLVVLRRRVPVSTVLAAAGAALLIAYVLTSSSIGVDARPLPPSHPIAQGNALVDQRLNGTVPIDVEFAGSPDDFKKPEVLQRVDALTNWLRDEYDVQATGLSSTLRGMAGIVTGVDSVPPNPSDVTTLLTEMDAFDGGVLLRSLVNEDFSRTRLIAYWPDRGEQALAAMADRFDTIAAALLTDTGIAARLTGRLPATQEAPSALADALGTIGITLVVLAGVLALAGGWARHRLARAEWSADWATSPDEPEPSSLFARAFHRHDHHAHARAPVPPDPDEIPALVARPRPEPVPPTRAPARTVDPAADHTAGLADDDLAALDDFDSLAASVHADPTTGEPDV